MKQINYKFLFFCNFEVYEYHCPNFFDSLNKFEEQFLHQKLSRVHLVGFVHPTNDWPNASKMAFFEFYPPYYGAAYILPYLLLDELDGSNLIPKKNTFSIICLINFYS